MRRALAVLQFLATVWALEALALLSIIVMLAPLFLVVWLLGMGCARPDERLLEACRRYQQGFGEPPEACAEMLR